MGGTMTKIKLYSLKELATLLSVTERTLHNYIKSGKMKGQKIGGKWQISETNLQKFLNGDT
jgi:excisionase family DNA binding protein